MPLLFFGVVHWSVEQATRAFFVKSMSSSSTRPGSSLCGSPACGSGSADAAAVSTSTEVSGSLPSGKPAGRRHGLPGSDNRSPGSGHLDQIRTPSLRLISFGDPPASNGLAVAGRHSTASSVGPDRRLEQVEENRCKTLKKQA